MMRYPWDKVEWYMFHCPECDGEMVMIHHDETPYQCTACSKMFSDFVSTPPPRRPDPIEVTYG